MTDFEKDDHGKPRYGLIPPHAELELARVLTMGAEKYGADNWRAGGAESIPRYVDAAQRHIAAYRRGEELDGESGLQHLAHAVASLMFIMELGVEVREGKRDQEADLPDALRAELEAEIAGREGSDE